MNAPAAAKLRQLIENAAERIPGHPYMHRAGRVPGTREAVVHPNYIMIYQMGVDRIDILAVLMPASNIPDLGNRGAGR